MSLSEDYSLREMKETDLETILKWRNSNRIRENMINDHIISMDEHRDWFVRLMQQKKDIYLIFQHSNLPAGMVYFTDIDKRNNICFWGFYLGNEILPKGTGLILGIMGLEYAFNKLGIRKICGQVFSFNTSSLEFHKKLGFMEEGRLIKHVLKNQKYEDIISFALFKEDWDTKKNSILKQTFTKRG